MKGGLAAIMLAAARAADLRLAGDLIVTAVADEEALSIGSERIAATVRADAAIVTEPTDMRLAIAHRGFLWLEIETQGVAAHGSRYDLGVDAISRMGPVLVALERFDERLRAGVPGHPLLGYASLHASLIEGGQELSTYPERCVLQIERRTLPGRDGRARRGADPRDRIRGDGHDAVRARADGDPGGLPDRGLPAPEREPAARRATRDRRRPRTGPTPRSSPLPASRQSSSALVARARTRRSSGSTSADVELTADIVLATAAEFCA